MKLKIALRTYITFFLSMRALGCRTIYLDLFSREQLAVALTPIIGHQLILHVCGDLPKKPGCRIYLPHSQLLLPNQCHAFITHNILEPYFARGHTFRSSSSALVILPASSFAWHSTVRIDSMFACRRLWVSAAVALNTDGCTYRLRDEKCDSAEFIFEFFPPKPEKSSEDTMTSHLQPSL